MKQQWEKVWIKTDDGETRQGIAPVIISASRATDIPAFHSRWFINRLEKGYVRWENRFSPANPKYISLENVRLIVFWTKNPAPIIPHLEVIERKNLNFYFQYTLNDYESEKLEQAVPPLKQRIEIFKRLSERIGKERVIWRFDPLLLAEQMSVDDLLGKVRNIGNQLARHTDKLVFSFADVFNYPRVKANLIKDSDYFNETNIHFAEFTTDKKNEMAVGLRDLLNEWRTINPDFTMATCAEDVDLERYGIAHNKCIDDELMIRLFPNDTELMSFIGYTPGLFGNDTRTTVQKQSLKDKNQRPLCGCVYSKDVGCYSTCAHYCTYCYANTSRELVARNMERSNPDSDTILSIEQ
jgi:DNA repair photolyase